MDGATGPKFLMLFSLKTKESTVCL